MITFVLRTAFIITLSIGFGLFWQSPSVQAQGFTDADAISLSINGSTVQPNTETAVTLEAYTIDMVGATIRWFVDDVEVVSARGERSLIVKAGPIGSKKVVRASIVRPGKSTIAASLTLSPAIIDIVVEAETQTPVFYEGRALPAAGGTVRLIAVPITGSAADPAAFSYAWKRNGNSVLGGPALGRQAVEIETSRYGKERMSVTVYDAGGNNLGSAAISHSVVEPELYFYENNPLFGLSRRAITDTFTMLGDEVTISAEPYFIERETISAPNEYEWRIDGRVVNESTQTTQSIVLQRAANAGTAKIDLEFITGQSLPQLIRSSFSLFYQ